jgi:hypothetical protein
MSTPDFVGYNHTAPMFITVRVRITFDTKCVGISRSISVTTTDGIHIITTEPRAGDVRKAVMLLYILNKTSNENCILMGYYAVSSSICLPTFRDNRSVPSQTVKTCYFTLAVRPDSLSRKASIPEQRSFHLHRGGRLKSRTRWAMCLWRNDEARPCVHCC